MKTTLKDFYYIYVLTGSNYIKPVIKSFDFIPDNANVVIITNTPKILESVKVKFNLIIEDLESLRPDWSKNHEVVLDIEDESEYMAKLSQMYDEGYKYPMGIMRYGIKWAIKNNITKFVVTDCGSKVKYCSDPEEALEKFNNFATNRDLLFGSIYFIQNNNVTKPVIFEEYSEVISKHFPFITKENYPEFIDDSVETKFTNITDACFDGHTLGFWFDKISSLETLFNFWEDMSKDYYENNKNNFNYSEWIEGFEYIISAISSIYSRYYNTYICGHQNIIRHFYTPENDFFGVALKYNTNPIWESTNTREEFLKVNKDKLISHYGGINKAKDLIYGFEEICNN